MEMLPLHCRLTLTIAVNIPPPQAAGRGLTVAAESWRGATLSAPR